MIKIKFYFVDNSYREYTENNPAFLQRLKRMQNERLMGKELINKLFADDWGAPPKFVKIIGTDSKGKPVNIQLNYE